MKNKVIVMTLASIIILTASLSGCGSAAKDESEAMDSTEIVDVENEKETDGLSENAEVIKDEAEDEEESEEEIKAQQEAEANEYYEKGRSDLYGINENEINLESAYANFEKAKDLGKQDANFYLGLLYDWYGYPEEDFEKAKAYYEENDDNPYATIAMGYLYYYGQGVELDIEKAEELFQRVINQGYVEGYLGIADINIDNEEITTALEALNKAVEGTEPVYVASAMNQIGAMYYSGEGVEQDYIEAAEWFEKAANLGDAAAMANIGWMYFNGEGVEQNYEKGFEWCNKSANLGNTTAMNYIGLMYYNGEGVEQDYEKALEWYEKSAELGNETAKESVETIKELLQ